MSDLECYSEDDVTRSIKRLHEVSSILVTSKKYKKDIEALEEMMYLIDHYGISDILKKGDD